MKYVLVAIATASLCATASAQPAKKVMVAPLDGGADAHPDLNKKLTDALVAAARDAGVAHAEGAIGLDELALMSGCSIDAKPCRKTLLATLKADSIVAGSVAAADGGVEVTLVLVDKNAEISSQRHTLEGSSSDELLAAFQPIAAAVFGAEVTTDPKATDPGGTDPGTTDPGGTDPGGTDPGGTDPGGTDPGGTDPGGSDPGGSDPGGSAGPLGPGNPGGQSDSGGRRLLPYGLIGAGVALTAGGLVTLVLAGKVQNDIDDAPTSTAADLEALEELEDKGRFRYRLSYGLLAAGGVSLAAGITLALIQRSEPRRTAAVVKTDGGYAAMIGGTF